MRVDICRGGRVAYRVVARQSAVGAICQQQGDGHRLANADIGIGERAGAAHAQGFAAHQTINRPQCCHRIGQTVEGLVFG